MLFLGGYLPLALLCLSLLESDATDAFMGHCYLAFVLVPIGIGLLAMSRLPSSLAGGLLVGAAGLMAVSVGALQLLLLFFSARSMVCFTAVLALMQIPFVVSHLPHLKEKLTQPRFAHMTFIAVIFATLFALKQFVYSDYPGAYTPACLAIMFSTATLCIPGHPWSSASWIQTSVCLLGALVVTISGIYM